MTAETAGPRPPADTGLFDFRNVANFPRDYLATYYCQPPTIDERVVLGFLAQHYRKLTSQPCAIEIGCGPTVHHVLPLAPFVSEIHMADYLPENLDQVRRWRDGEPDAHRWQEYTALTLSLEGRPNGQADIERRELDTKRKMTRFMLCDLKSDTPLRIPEAGSGGVLVLLRREHRDHKGRVVQGHAAPGELDATRRVSLLVGPSRDRLLRGHVLRRHLAPTFPRPF